MDIFKAATMRDYTSWDLNAKCVHIRNRQSIEKMFKRKARRINRAEMRTEKKNFSEMLKEKLDNSSWV